MRFVHQTPQYDARGQASNFFVDKWNAAAAPVLYVAGCANGVYPCTGTNRQAMNPLTGQFLGPNTHARDRHHGAEQRQPDQRSRPGRPGHPAQRPIFSPRSASAPRFGMAYDLTGRQQLVLRGGGGLYFDRPSGNAVFAQVLNPPVDGDR